MGLKKSLLIVFLNLLNLKMWKLQNRSRIHLISLNPILLKKEKLTILSVILMTQQTTLKLLTMSWEKLQTHILYQEQNSLPL